MKRTRFSRRGGLGQDAAQLTRLADGLALSASRVEDRYWESRLTELVARLLADRNEETLSGALDAAALRAAGHDPVMVREPGGTPAAEALREPTMATQGCAASAVSPR